MISSHSKKGHEVICRLKFGAPYNYSIYAETLTFINNVDKKHNKSYCIKVSYRRTIIFTIQLKCFSFPFRLN